MKAQIFNFKGIKEASIDIAPLALVTGSNYQGKSSIALAIAAAASCNNKPVGGLTKESSRKLVYEGEDTACVRLIGTKGKTSISWPIVDEPKSEGNPVYSSEYATGLKDFTADDTKTRAQTLINVLHAEPTLEDLKKALSTGENRELEIEKERIEKIFSKTMQDGWDTTFKNAEKHGQTLKGQWKQLTTQNYGTKQSASWQPEALPFGHEKLKQDELEADIKKLEEARDKAVAVKAIDTHEQQRFRDLIDLLPERQKILVATEDKIISARKALKDTQKELATLPPIMPDDKGIPCPHCNTHLVIETDLLGITQLKRAGSTTKEELKQREDIRKKLAKSENESQETLTALLAEEHKAKFAVEESKVAATKYNPDTPGQSAEEINNAIGTATIALNEAKAGLAAFLQYTEAQQLLKSVAQNDAIKDALSPTGVRQIKLKEAIIGFNTGTLADLCGKFGVSQVNLNSESLEIYYGTRPFELLSKCEKFIVRTVLQVAVAKHDNSELLVIDDADELNSSTDKGGLIRMVLDSKIPAVICMAMQADISRPNFEAQGNGKTYLISGGEATPFNVQAGTIVTAEHVTPVKVGAAA